MYIKKKKRDRVGERERRRESEVEREEREEDGKREREREREKQRTQKNLARTVGILTQNKNPTGPSGVIKISLRRTEIAIDHKVFKSSLPYSP